MNDINVTTNNYSGGILGKAAGAVINKAIRITASKLDRISKKLKKVNPDNLSVKEGFYQARENKDAFRMANVERQESLENKEQKLNKIMAKLEKASKKIKLPSKAHENIVKNSGESKVTYIPGVYVYDFASKQYAKADGKTLDSFINENSKDVEPSITNSQTKAPEQKPEAKEQTPPVNLAELVQQEPITYTTNMQNTSGAPKVGPDALAEIAQLANLGNIHSTGESLQPEQKQEPTPRIKPAGRKVVPVRVNRQSTEPAVKQEEIQSPVNSNENNQTLSVADIMRKAQLVRERQTQLNEQLTKEEGILSAKEEAVNQQREINGRRAQALQDKIEEITRENERKQREIDSVIEKQEAANKANEALLQEQEQINAMLREFGQSQQPVQNNRHM